MKLPGWSSALFRLCLNSSVCFGSKPFSAILIGSAASKMNACPHIIPNSREVDCAPSQKALVSNPTI
jgi:hypothetical protein